MSAPWSIFRAFYRNGLTPTKTCVLCHKTTTYRTYRHIVQNEKIDSSFKWILIYSRHNVYSCSQSRAVSNTGSRTPHEPVTKENRKVSEVKTEKYKYERITYDILTPPGQKKDTTAALSSTYSPEFVEAVWYDWWVQQGYFRPEATTGGEERDTFVMCLPPPNVTGTLHLGHALTNSIQDAIARWNRMRGRRVLWLPGCDHAGIATQVVVEKRLWQERGVTRHDIGRDEFIKEVWKWKQEKGDTIYNQMKKLGSSLDWERACFTMDERLSTAVTEAFVRLHDDGLIFRSQRMVNWCCHLKSAISDIEVEPLALEGRSKLRLPGYEEEVELGTMTTFSYPVVGSDEEIRVSTTRPETMLGDTAIAVHPDDTRYTHLHGRHAYHPLGHRTIPIICDSYVQKDLGTGAVKITPAHDPNDYEIGQRHKLSSINVINDDGKMENVPDKYIGMKRFHAREAVVEDLTDLGLYKGTESHEMVIPLCSRSKDVIEPLLKDQWFLNCKDMAKQAAEVVRSGELKLRPSYTEKLWFHWLDNCQDWCLSRQIWWGHRIPAYVVTIRNQESGERVWVSARTMEEARVKAADRLGVSPDLLCLKQDEDVLDTWFSSGLFPFSPLGWPSKTADLERFYPTNLLETGNDIIYFWVARMVMLGLKLTGQLPFREVLLHGTLRDTHGRKMSKSLGNVIDPMDVIHGISLKELQQQLKSSNLDPTEIARARETQAADFPRGIPPCGTDGLRFGLCSLDYSSEAVNLDMVYIESKHRFCNKIWQGFRFVLANVGLDFTPVHDFKTDVTVTAVLDQWILSRLSHMVTSCDQHFTSYELHIVTESLHTFWINDFCDIYLESVKSVLRENCSESDTVKQVLIFCVDTYLRALSPFMPYLTEELYQRLPMTTASDRPESVCMSPYPSTDAVPFLCDSVEEAVSVFRVLRREILSVMERHNIKARTLPVMLKVTDADLLHKLTEDSLWNTLLLLSKAKVIETVPVDQSPPRGCLVTTPHPGVEIWFMLKGIMDPKKEIARLEKKILKLEKSEKQFSKNKRGQSMEDYNEGLQKIWQNRQEYEKKILEMKQLDMEQSD